MDEKIDTSDEACAVACMLVSNPQGAFRKDGDGWQKRVNDLIRALRDERKWKPIETAPENEDVLTYWPKKKLKDDGSLSDEIVGGAQAVSMLAGGGWSEPDFANATGDWFGDDFEFDWPTHWMPLPPDPTA